MCFSHPYLGLSFLILNLFIIFKCCPHGGALSYKPPAPSLYEVSSHVKNYRFGHIKLSLFSLVRSRRTGSTSTSLVRSARRGSLDWSMISSTGVAGASSPSSRSVERRSCCSSWVRAARSYTARSAYTICT